jgi:Ankyrin repeats (3 copies)
MTHFVQLLSSKSINVNAKNHPYGETALHLACVFGKADFAAALLDNGADINSVTDTGATAALTAAIHGSTECLQLLVERGADLSIRDNAGHTILHAAATWAHVQCVSLLLSCSKDIVGDVNTLSADGSSPLMLCLSNTIQLNLQAHDRQFLYKSDTQRCAQLLLDNSAGLAPDMLSQLCRLVDDDNHDIDGGNDKPTAAMRALSTYMTRLRSTVAARTAIIAIHAQACSTISTHQHTDTAVHTDGTNSSSIVSSGSSDNSSSAATSNAAQQQSSVTVQLVHAVTGVKAAKLYKLELRTLERLLAVHSSVGKTSSVLLKLLKPSSGWRAQEQTRGVVELKYDCKCSYRQIYCSIVYSIAAANVLCVQAVSPSL